MLRLVIHIVRPKRADLLNVAIPPVEGDHETRRLKSEEFWTPGGLPLTVSVCIGAKGDWLRVETAGTLLLRVHSDWPEGGEVGLLLPTDESLLISVFDAK